MFRFSPVGRADESCATSEFLCDLVAFLHDDIGLETETVLRRLGFRVMRPGVPLDLDEIEDKVSQRQAAAAAVVVVVAAAAV